MFYAGVARGAESQIFFVAHEFNFIVVAVKFSAKFGAVVGRRVVDQNYFEILKRLCQNAVDAKFYVAFDFIHRHDDGNTRIRHVITSKKFR